MVEQLLENLFIKGTHSDSTMNRLLYREKLARRLKKPRRKKPVSQPPAKKNWIRSRIRFSEKQLFTGFITTKAGRKQPPGVVFQKELSR